MLEPHQAPHVVAGGPHRHRGPTDRMHELVVQVADAGELALQQTRPLAASRHLPAKRVPETRELCHSDEPCRPRVLRFTRESARNRLEKGKHLQKSIGSHHEPGPLGPAASAIGERRVAAVPVRRALGMKLGQANEAGQDLLLQRADINECVNGGISGRLACLSHSAHLPLKSFMGQPVEVQIVTDRGELRRICAISTGARVGQSDGSLTLYELDVEDALGLMARRINSRIFRKKNDPAIIQLLLAEWRQRSPALAASFDFVVHGLNTERYPERELTHQVNESDAAFVKRLLKRSGISWFFRPGQDGDTPFTKWCCSIRPGHWTPIRQPDPLPQRRRDRAARRHHPHHANA